VTSMAEASEHARRDVLSACLLKQEKREHPLLHSRQSMSGASLSSGLARPPRLLPSPPNIKTIIHGLVAASGVPGACDGAQPERLRGAACPRPVLTAPRASEKGNDACPLCFFFSEIWTEKRKRE
jgi:hypothetical protein